MPFLLHNDLKFLYLHVPKTGGSSIEAWLRRIAPLRFHTVGVPVAMKVTPQHLRMSDYNHLFGDVFFDRVVMTVRNPYTRIASEYRMRAELAGQGFWKAAPTFSHWLETHLARAVQDPFLLDNHIRPQWEFVGTGVEVLRFEDGLPAILTRIAAILGERPPETVPHVFPTRRDLAPVVFDRSDKLRMQQFYGRDFAEFGYDPEQVPD